MTKYEVKYKTKAGELHAELYANNKLEHEINADHLVWEHLYKNGWVK